MKIVELGSKSTKLVILEHLKLNKGREIPVSEISKTYNFKLNRISNAIKELEYKGRIKAEKRALTGNKHGSRGGQYTVIRLVGDSITEPYIHEREKYPKKIEESLQKENLMTQEKLEVDKLITYLLLDNYDQDVLVTNLNIIAQDPYEFVFKFLQPLQFEVGDQWAVGKISTSEEHIISARIEKLLIKIMPLNPLSKSTTSIFLIPVENEAHVLSLLSLEFILRSKNHFTINLGRTLPISDIVTYIQNLKTNKTIWLFISITLRHYINNLRHDLRYIREEKKISDKKVKIAIGGQAIVENDITDFPEANKIIRTEQELRNFIDFDLK